MAKNAVVIGSGFGGLAAAIRLQAKGYHTILLEMRDQPGGRAYVYKQDGFTFDAGPTIITAPILIDELFSLAGKKKEDYVQLVACEPFYRMIAHDGMSFDYSSSPEAMVEQIERISQKDVKGYHRFLAQSRQVFDRAFVDLADKPFSTVKDMLRVTPDLIRLRAFESVYKMVSNHVSHPFLRVVLSFHPLLVGGNPFTVSSIYSMIHSLEKQWGVHFVMGGTGALVTALVELFKGMGGELRLNSRAEEILVQNKHVKGVRLSNGSTLETELVVSNGDVANTYRKLLRPVWRSKWTNKRLERMHYSMGLFLIYFGTNRTYSNLAHHTILLSDRYAGLLEDIFERKVIARDFSLYLHAPTRTDPSLAPHGCECFYVLSPVPNLKGNIDWDLEKEAYAEEILIALEKICPELRKHIVTKKIMTPKDFEQELDAYMGSAFQFEPILTQTAWFRPHNLSEEVKGLYLVGAGTHPGAGLPGVLSSAKVLDGILASAA